MNELKFLLDYKNVRMSTEENDLEVLGYRRMIGINRIIIALVNHAN